MMQEINKFRTFNQLKTVYRYNVVGQRNESSAEHSWSCLLLADFFLSKLKLDLDRMHVYELLMYHDVVEIEAGDTPLHPGAKNQYFRKQKVEKEKQAAKKLQENLPPNLGKKFLQLFEEFEAQETLEAKFAKAIDTLDATIHQLDYKDAWQDWSKEFLVEKKLGIIGEVPMIKEAFFEVVEYMEVNHYFNEK